MKGNAGRREEMFWVQMKKKKSEQMVREVLEITEKYDSIEVSGSRQEKSATRRNQKKHQEGGKEEAEGSEKGGGMWEKKYNSPSPQLQQQQSRSVDGLSVSLRSLTCSIQCLNQRHPGPTTCIFHLFNVPVGNM